MEIIVFIIINRVGHNIVDLTQSIWSCKNKTLDQLRLENRLPLGGHMEQATAIFSTSQVAPSIRGLCNIMILQKPLIDGATCDVEKWP